MISGIRPGDVFIAADKGHYGHLVTDVTTFASCDDVVTTPFDEHTVHPGGNRIDFFKLTRVRYYRVDDLPTWIPEAIRNAYLGGKFP